MAHRSSDTPATDLAALLAKPANLTNESAAAWFDRIAHCLLNEYHLTVGGEAHRLAEIEFYYHASIHPDPFSHRDPVTQHPGRWYFHRSHGVYRGGSFKGADLSFGDSEAFGGVLFRSLVLPSPLGGEGRKKANPSPPWGEGRDGCRPVVAGRSSAGPFGGG